MIYSPMKKVLFALFAMVAAVSCNTGELPPPRIASFVDIEHRVHGYWLFDGIEMWEPGSSVLESGIYVPRVHIGMSKPECLAAFNSEGEVFERYIERCDRFGDWGCDYYSYYSNLLAKGAIDGIKIVDYPYVIYSGVEFVKIDVTCESDFDTDHPAGASLSDIMVLATFTHRPIIDGLDGKTCYDPVPDSEWDPRLKPVDRPFVDIQPGYLVYKRLDRLTEYDLSMIGEWEYRSMDTSSVKRYYLGKMYFLRIPDKLGAYKFRISFVTSDGREMVMHPTYQWEERDATIL